MSSILEFEWDPNKAERNHRKHGISFNEASSVFGDKFARIIFDSEHSDDEERYIIIGETIRGRLIVVGYTERDTRIRLITARIADPCERRDHERKK